MLDNKNGFKNIIILEKDKFDCLCLILWAWFKNIKIIIVAPDIFSSLANFLTKFYFIKRYIKVSIRNHSLVLGGYKGLLYEINKETIDLTLAFYNQKLKNKNKLLGYYNTIFKTNKFEAFVKKAISFQVFILLQQFHLIRLSGFYGKEVLLIKDPLNEFIVEYMSCKNKVNYKIKWVIPLWRTFSLGIYYGWLFIDFIYRGIVFNKHKKEYKLAKEAVWGFHRPTLRDDIIIDGYKFKISDMLMLEFDNKDNYRLRAYNMAGKKGFDAISVPRLKININGDIFNLIFLYVFVPLRIFMYLILKQQLYLFYYISSFHRQCFPIEILMSRYRIKCHISTKDYDDVATTIILNKYKAKTVIFHWSDITGYKAFYCVFLAHNIFFTWGNIHQEYHGDNHFVDRKVNTGCIYKKEYNKILRNKEHITAQVVGLNNKSKIVAFFDESFNNYCEYTEYFFLQYLETIKEFCAINRNIQVLLKPKTGVSYGTLVTEPNREYFKKVWDELIKYDNFHCLDHSRWSAEEIIAISDVCINMGMNTPSTIALICGKDAFYFDNTGNIYHPFAKKYKNIIVFEDKELLFQQIDDTLKGKFKCRDVIGEKEIREYDAFGDDNALERIRDNLYELTMSN